MFAPLQTVDKPAFSETVRIGIVVFYIHDSAAAPESFIRIIVDGHGRVTIQIGTSFEGIF